ncbi:MAG: cytochrome c biogenesis protein CcsA [Candidatus Competibacteraceae bacterium]|nr:cytochrome c biogenesis protein CcsA [Candidatus Competibacteraceae bacterium]
MNTIYNGENLLPGTLGNIFIALSIAAAMMASLSYYMATRNQLGNSGWKRLGRIGFLLHSLGVLGSIITLFYILLAHRFEYQYAWQHTSRELPSKYVFAAFWEGQEGSFLLWSFWHVVTGLILMKTSRNREPWLMTIVAVVQIFISSMIAGAIIDIPGLIEYKLGSNPFVLTRLHPSTAGMAILQNPDYLQILDGRGINPSLQNYWMTLHPPMLFFGFALTLVPYAYAISGIWQKKYTEWFKPAIPWAFAGIAILGGGILMGGAWAYEALNFGGFWAWDPVENSSLVPWLTLVAGAHLLLIRKNNGTTLFLTYFLILLSFVLVLYSTFLTRSGVLGDASVHSFTDLGMTGQLLIYLLFFIWLPIRLFIQKKSHQYGYIALSAIMLLAGLALNFSPVIKMLYLIFAGASLAIAFFEAKKSFPATESGEHFLSREFFLFAASLVILISVIHLTFETSKPVINKLAGTQYAPGNVETYNQVQGVLAVVITIFMAVTLFLQYRKNNLDLFWSKIMRTIIITTLLTLAAGIIFPDFRNPRYILLCFTSGFAVLANADFIFRYQRKNLRQAGSAFAHIGFGLIILGAVVSGGHKKFISKNTSQINLEALNAEFRNDENIMLHLKDTLPMLNYYLSYQGDTLIGNVAHYRVDYYKKQNNRLEKAFTLYPKLILNERMGNSPEPATKHFLHQDIFTHVTYVDIENLKRKNQQAPPSYSEPQHFTIADKDTIFGSRFFVVFEGLQSFSDINSSNEDSLYIGLHAIFSVYNAQGAKIDEIKAVYEIKGNYAYSSPGTGENAGLKIEVERINPSSRTIDANLSELQGGNLNNFIIMQAIIFPGINILWAGCILMILGIFISVLNRLLKHS